MSGNFGTPRPQPLPLSQAPVHKVTEWRTIQKYHFFGGLSGIIIEILFARHFFCRAIQGSDRNIWHHGDFFFSKFLLLIRSSIWQKYCLVSNEISLQLRETKSLLVGVILPSESSLELRSQIRTLSQLQEQESCQKASSGTLNKHTPARKETRDAAERTAMAVNLRQHRWRQLLRGNEREWFLKEAVGFATERFCSRTSCHRQRGLSEFIYKIYYSWFSNYSSWLVTYNGNEIWKGRFFCAWFWHAPKFLERPKCGSQSERTKKKKIEIHSLVCNICEVGGCVKAF